MLHCQLIWGHNYNVPLKNKTELVDNLSWLVKYATQSSTGCLHHNEHGVIHPETDYIQLDVLMNNDFTILWNKSVQQH
jgi:hypothetical protein